MAGKKIASDETDYEWKSRHDKEKEYANSLLMGIDVFKHFTEREKQIEEQWYDVDKPVKEIFSLKDIESMDNDEELIDLVDNYLSDKWYDMVDFANDNQRMIYALNEATYAIEQEWFDKFFNEKEDAELMEKGEFAYKGFIAIGANDYAKLMKRANELYKTFSEDTTFEEEMSAWDKLSEGTESLKDDIPTLKVAFIRKHLSELIEKDA